MVTDRIELHRIPKDIALGVATLGVVIAGISIAVASESIQIMQGQLPALRLSTGIGNIEINELGIYRVSLEPCPPKRLRHAGAKVEATELIVEFPRWMRWNLPYGNIRSPYGWKDYRSCLTPNTV